MTRSRQYAGGSRARGAGWAGLLVVGWLLAAALAPAPAGPDRAQGVRTVALEAGDVVDLPAPAERLAPAPPPCPDIPSPPFRPAVEVGGWAAGVHFVMSGRDSCWGTTLPPPASVS